MKPGRYVSKHHEAMIEKERLSKDRGGFPMDGMPWTNEEVDLLFECWIIRELPATSPDPKRDSFQTVLGRSPKSIRTKIPKLSIRYKEDPTFLYISGKRTDRTGTPFKFQDFYIIKQAANESGIENGAHDPAWIGQILGRKPIEIIEWIEKKDKENYGLFIPKEMGWDHVCRRVNKLMPEKFGDILTY
jgi:hypothetical protein